MLLFGAISGCPLWNHISVYLCYTRARKLHDDNDEGLFELPFEELDLALLCWAISGTLESHCSVLILYIGEE